MDALWFYLEVDSSDAADPVKQRGPLTAQDMVQLWKKKNIDDETYVWADGMADFAQIKDTAGLKEVLAPPAAADPTGPTSAPVSAPAPAPVASQSAAPKAEAKSSSVVSAGILTWYYKNKQGVKLGPSVLDTLKIMWDFGEVRTAITARILQATMHLRAEHANAHSGHNCSHSVYMGGTWTCTYHTPLVCASPLVPSFLMCS